MLNNNNNILFRTYGPYHRHKSTKNWLAIHQRTLQKRCLHMTNIGRSKTFILTTAVSPFTHNIGILYRVVFLYPFWNTKFFKQVFYLKQINFITGGPLQRGARANCPRCPPLIWPCMHRVILYTGPALARAGPDWKHFCGAPTLWRLRKFLRWASSHNDRNRWC